MPPLTRFSRERAIRVQRIIADKVLIKPLSQPRVVAAVDVAYSRATATSHAAAVAYDVRAGKVVAQSTAQVRTPLPYMPGFLAFRELTPMLLALSRLGTRYDVILVDGHGISHPRGAGIATHLGVIMDRPTVGVAKKILVGRLVKEGDRMLVYHEGRPVAMVHDRQGRWKPLYVSPGHRSDLESAYRLVDMLRTTPGLPTPLKEADKLSKALKKATRGREEAPRNAKLF